MSKSRQPSACVSDDTLQAAADYLRALDAIAELEKQNEQALARMILDHLHVKCTRQGQSLAFLYGVVRDAGWSRLGTLQDFEKLCERLGFTVVKTYKKNTASVVSTWIQITRIIE